MIKARVTDHPRLGDVGAQHHHTARGDRPRRWRHGTGERGPSGGGPSVNLATNASLRPPPGFGRMMPGGVGKLADKVVPVTWALPPACTAMPLPLSWPLPPR